MEKNLDKTLLLDSSNEENSEASVIQKEKNTFFDEDMSSISDIGEKNDLYTGEEIIGGGNKDDIRELVDNIKSNKIKDEENIKFKKIVKEWQSNMSKKMSDNFLTFKKEENTLTFMNKKTKRK